MRGNVPDDWNSYYRRCGLCGARVHASEGGCSCADELDEQGCMCGEMEWTSDGCDVYCEHCGEKPGTPLDPNYWEE